LRKELRSCATCATTHFPDVWQKRVFPLEMSTSLNSLTNILTEAETGGRCSKNGGEVLDKLNDRRLFDEDTVSSKQTVLKDDSIALQTKQRDYRACDPDLNLTSGRSCCSMGSFTAHSLFAVS
jgi:hypothetical protein